MTSTLRQLGVAVRALVLATVVLGVIYPAVVWGFGRLVSDRADGSFVTAADGRVVGSSLIGQEFTGPRWFHPRPSAAGDGYDAMASAGSNLGPSNPELVDEITQRQKIAAAANGVPVADLPPDALTASSSGLDPDISPEYALLQVDRVARARGLDPDQVRHLVDQQTAAQEWGIFGQPRVNVLLLNLALDNM
ncbi:MAG: potassium-transporting ATPase subunit KdpC [Candidatus Nanopelagicales bacterium]